jgi:hypothetical protein
MYNYHDLAFILWSFFDLNSGPTWDGSTYPPGKLACFTTNNKNVNQTRMGQLLGEIRTDN